MYDEPELALPLPRQGYGFLPRIERANIRRGRRSHRRLLHRQRLRLHDGPADRAGALRPIHRSLPPAAHRPRALGGAQGHAPLLRGIPPPAIPLMIRDGLDALHALQPRCAGMDPAGLKRDFGARILLNGAIDSQSRTHRGERRPPCAKRRCARSRIMAPGGGYVAGASHDYLLEETPLENVLAMFDAIREYKEKRHAT